MIKLSKIQIESKIYKIIRKTKINDLSLLFNWNGKLSFSRLKCLGKVPKEKKETTVPFKMYTLYELPTFLVILNITY